MFTVYDVQAWLVALPWALFGFAALILWRSVVCGKRWMRKYDQELYNFKMSNMACIKAEATARKSDAAHKEAVRKLEEARKDIRIWEKTCEKMSKLTPKRGENGRFAPKKPTERKKK